MSTRPTQRCFLLIVLISSAVLSLAWAQPALKAEAPKTYTYKVLDKNRELKVDVYRPDDDAVRPVVRFIHGGALIMGDRGLSTRSGTLLDALVKGGYVVVSMDYRLAPEVKLPAILQDVEDACKWVREKGPHLCRIDPARLAV